MRFFVWDYHLASGFQRRSLAQFVEWWHMGPAAIVALVVGWCCAWELIRRRAWAEIGLLATATVGVVLPMIPVSAYGSYITPVIPLCAAAGLVGLWTAEQARGNPMRHLLWVLPAVVLFHPLPDESGVKGTKRILT